MATQPQNPQDEWQRLLGGPQAPPPAGGPAPMAPQGQPAGPAFDRLGVQPKTQPGASPFDPLATATAAPPPVPAYDRSPGGQAVTPMPRSMPDPTTPGGPAPPPGQAPVPGQTPPPGQAPPAPGGAPDQQGINQFQQWAQQTFGRQATPQELQQIAQQVGYTGGALTPEMMTRAQDAARTLAQGQGWKPPGATTPQQPSLKDSIQQQLQNLLNQNPNQIDPNSPEFASQRNAFRRGQQRSIEQAKRNAAQRNAQGFTGGANESAMTGIDLAAAQGEGDFEAQLYTQELGARRQQLQQALSQAIQYGLGDQAQQIQQELGRNDLELRRYLGRGQLGLGLLQTMLGNEQSRNALGFNYAALQGQMDQQLLNALLGGLR